MSLARALASIHNAGYAKPAAFSPDGYPAVEHSEGADFAPVPSRSEIQPP